MIYLVAIVKGRPNDAALRQVFRSYVERIRRYVPVEEATFRDQEALASWWDRLAGGSAGLLVLLDSRGKSLTSKDFAAEIGRWRDAGKRQIVIAVGPADGWSAEARAKADFLLSFGPMTLPHELAAVVAAEQVYRAFTILAGHPYHCGH